MHLFEEYQAIIVQKINKPPEGNRWVIPDIHGCVNTFKELVKNIIQLKQNDQLFLLGDYIDRGPDSGGVIDFILELEALGFQVYPLRGNHEELFLEAYQEYPPRLLKKLLKLQKCFGMQDKHGEVWEYYLEFMQKLPYCYELDDFLLVHAGFNMEAPFTDTKGMLWLRSFEYDGSKLKNKRVIHGHIPTAWKDIQRMVNEKEFNISLDGGCAYTRPRKHFDITDLGRLCALNLDTWELRFQKNIEESIS